MNLLGQTAPANLSTLFREATQREKAEDFNAALSGYATMLQTLLDSGQTVPEHLCDRLARCCSRLGQPHTAIRVLVAARTRMQALGDAYGVFHVNTRLAEICLEALDLDSAKKFLLDALGIKGQQLEDDVMVLAHVETMKWPGADAKSEAKAHAQAFLLLARYWTAIGRIESAISATRAAHKEVERSSVAQQFFSLPEMDVAIVDLYLDAGDVSTARDVENEARARYSKNKATPFDETPWIAIAARRASLEGRLSEARRWLQKLVQGADKPITRRHAQVVFLHVGLLVQLNRLAEAESHLTDLEKRLGPDAAQTTTRREIEMQRWTIRTKREAASDDVAMPFVPEQVLDDDDHEAEIVAGKLRDMRQIRPAAQPPRSKERFVQEWSVRANRVIVALADERLEDAEAYVDALEQFAAPADARRLHTRTRYYRALFDHARGEYGAAREALIKCVQDAAEQGLPLDKLLYLERLAWTCARLGHGDEYKQRAAEAKVLQDEIIAAFDHEDRVFWNLNRMSRQDEFVAARIATIGSVPEPRLPIASLRSFVHRIRIRNATLERYREVAHLSGWPITRSLTGETEKESANEALVLDPDRATESEQVEAWVRAQLTLASRTNAGKRSGKTFLERFLPLHRIPEKVAVIHYHCVADRLFVFVLVKGKITVRVLGTTRVALYESIREVLAEIIQQWQARIGERRVVNALHRLSKALGINDIFTPLANSIEHVIVVPHGVLVHVPFAALPFGDQRLCERFVSSIAPGTSFVDLGGATSQRPLLPGKLFGVAVEEYPGTSWKSLPGATDEINRVASFMPDKNASTTLSGLAAQPNSILEGLEKSEIAHVACHGLFDQDQPHRSRLIVAGTEDTIGEITLEQIQTRNFSPLKLAVLASCWTASSAVLPGQEVVSLPAAFLRAGARSVMAPLWEVDDSMSSAFMKDFYHACARLPSARALAEVQRKWLHENAREKGMAFHWAAHVHYGQGA